MAKKLFFICLIGSLLLSFGIASAKPPKSPADALLLLGKSIYNDKNLSINNNQSCKSCHHNNFGFVDPTNANNPSKNVVSRGSIRTETGGLNAPTAAYAFDSPPMNWSLVDELFIGGIFWNGRAHGHKEFNVSCLVPGYNVDPLFSPLAEQAQGPFTNPVEMALPDNAEVVDRVAAADYAYLFSLAFADVNFANVQRTFDQIAIAIAYFESSDTLNKFSSRYDTGDLTPEEQDGFELFKGGAMCVLCHVADGGPGAAMFTDFSYDNLGIPINPLIAAKGVDPGLGGFIQAVLANPGDFPQTLVDEIQLGIANGDGAFENLGKHKVSTLRNIALTPPYGHNGFFPNLTSIVQFYNTRDWLACSKMVGGTPVTPALLDAGIIPGYNVTGYCWPEPEVNTNVNVAELGNLGLSPAGVDSIVAFLKALTD